MTTYSIAPLRTPNKTHISPTRKRGNIGKKNAPRWRVGLGLGILKTLLLVFVAAQVSAAEGTGAKKAESPKVEASKSQVFEGQVLPLAEVVKTQSVAADEDALRVSRVLKAKDGKVYLLVKDVASRKFFVDDSLLRRPMKITAAQIPGTQILVVAQAQSLIDGKPHDIDYWCEECQLSYPEPGLCRCCGNPLELRELPVEPKPVIPSPNP